MKITKRQLKRIIREEKSRMLNEQSDVAAREFESIMEQIAELVEEAFEIAGRPEAARSYWYNGILGQVDPETHGMMNRSLSMADTLEELGGDAGDEDMMEMGYNDGMNGRPPAFPESEFYMVNYEDGMRDAK